MSYFVHREPLKYLIKKYPVTFTLIALVTLVYLIDYISGGRVFQYGALMPILVYVGDYHRLIISMFLHGSLLHFLSNTFFGLAIIGLGLEKLIGSVKYALVYFISGIGSSLIIYFANMYVESPFTSPFQVTIGASGAIYGSLGVFLFIVLHRREKILESDRQYLIGLFVINLVFTFIAPRISILGHLGGLLVGYLLGFILFYDGSKESKEHRRMQREWKRIQREYGE